MLWNIITLLVVLCGIALIGYVLSAVIGFVWSVIDGVANRKAAEKREAEYFKPRILKQYKNQNGFWVTEVEAINSDSAADIVRGTNPSGGHWVITKTDKHKFTIHGERNI